MERNLSYQDSANGVARPKYFSLVRLLLAAHLICLVMMGMLVVGPDHHANAQEASIFIGTCPPVVNSKGTLTLNDDLQNKKTFQWASSDSILGEIDTGSVTATTWNYLPGSPSRLVFVGSGGGAAFYGNVLFEDYNRAVVDVVKGAKRIRYLINLFKGSIAWVNEDFDEPDFIPIPFEEDSKPFNHEAGQPGGAGGFGGPPDGSGFTFLVDPFKIENLEVDDEGDSYPAVMTVLLISNLSTWSQGYTLTETAANSNIFSDEDDSLAIHVIKYSDHMVGEPDTMQLFMVSMAFGVRKSMVVHETGGDTNVFISEHLELVVTMQGLPDPSIEDNINATLMSNLKSDIIYDTLTETDKDTLVYENANKTFSISINRITTNGFANKDDFTASVTSNLFKVTDFRIDAIETGPDTLEFRTDALMNEGQPGTKPGAMSGLAIGSKWQPILKLDKNDPWPPSWKKDGEEKEEVKITRMRGAETVDLKDVKLQWRNDPPKVKGKTMNYPLLKGDKNQVWFLLEEDTGDADKKVFREDSGNIIVRVKPGDKLIAESKGPNKHRDEITVLKIEGNVTAEDKIDEPSTLDFDVNGDGNIDYRIPSRTFGKIMVYDMKTTPNGVMDPNTTWVISEKLSLVNFKVNDPDVPILVKSLIEKMVKDGITLGNNTKINLGSQTHPRIGKLKKNQFMDTLISNMPKDCNDWEIKIKQELFAQTSIGKVHFQTNVISHIKTQGAPDPVITITKQ